MTDRPEFLIKLLRCDRAPDEVIQRANESGKDYLRRWYIIPHAKVRAKTWWLLKQGNIFLHNFNRSDPDVRHDHPWWSFGMIINKGGRYIEHTPYGSFVRKRFQIVYRKATHEHRIELLRDETEIGELVPVWTIFITGPKTRDWGFACPRGWVPHWKFADPHNPNEIGAGCGDD
jgi:hypothetical protein